ncbi:MAG: hypothetical protein WCF84_24230 [Anaerolineae bacterium]
MNEPSHLPDQVFLTAARCADCAHPACIQACPEQIDLRALFEFIAAQAPMPLTWMRNPDEAENLIGQAIHNSFS